MDNDKMSGAYNNPKYSLGDGQAPEPVTDQQKDTQYRMQRSTSTQITQQTDTKNYNTKATSSNLAHSTPPSLYTEQSTMTSYSPPQTSIASSSENIHIHTPISLLHSHSSSEHLSDTQSSSTTPLSSPSLKIPSSNQELIRSSTETEIDENNNNSTPRRKRGRPPITKPAACLECGVTSTPDWRRGSHGPHTLCNRCGLLFAKKMKKELESRRRHSIDKLLNNNPRLQQVEQNKGEGLISST
eukprot:TRINITY_DN1999_c3_g1_i1.p1 TRINITY_DN1999_c3_g1~~TRINITY_DN1999_c3_g1_i1.p1  ORF type:complete len:242 (-),score=60.28 TRINITY_DN1999_c3_g1_i1:60-785(-)